MRKDIKSVERDLTAFDAAKAELETEIKKIQSSLLSSTADTLLQEADSLANNPAAAKAEHTTIGQLTQILKDTTELVKDPFDLTKQQAYKIKANKMGKSSFTAKLIGCMLMFVGVCAIAIGVAALFHTAGASSLLVLAGHALLTKAAVNIIPGIAVTGIGASFFAARNDFGIRGKARNVSDAAEYPQHSY